MSKQPFDIVFQGGGAKGIAHNGAVEALDRAGRSFRRLIGTSAGAITATLVAAGYDGAGLRRMSQEQTADGRSRMTEFISVPPPFGDDALMHSELGDILAKLDLPILPHAIEAKLELALLRLLDDAATFRHLFSFIELGGYYSADGFIRWLQQQLEAVEPGRSRMTFRQAFERTGVHLSLVTSDVTSQEMRVLNHVTTPSCPVLWGTRMSMSIPFLWPQVPWRSDWGTYTGANIDGHLMVDGGVVSNLALRLLVDDEPWIDALMGERPPGLYDVVALALDDRLPVPDAPPRAARPHLDLPPSKTLTRLEAILNTMMSSGDNLERAAHPALICSLPTGGYGVTEFDMSSARIAALLNSGCNATETYLSTRYPPSAPDEPIS